MHTLREGRLKTDMTTSVHRTQSSRQTPAPVLLAFALMIIWLVLPLVPIVVWSFAKRWFFPDLVPGEWSLQAWQYLFSPVSGLGKAISASLAIAIPVTLLSCCIGIPAGRALACYNFRGKRAVQLLVLAPVLVPGIAVITGLHGIMLNLELNNQLAGVIVAHLIPALPYMILVMASTFARFDTEFEAQARTLGANTFQVFTRVTLPAILPGIVIGALFTFLVSWSQYILTLIVGGGRVVTLPLLLFNFVSAGRNDVAGALGVIFILPGLIILIAVARFISGRSGIAELPSRL